VNEWVTRARKCKAIGTYAKQNGWESKPSDHTHRCNAQELRYVSCGAVMQSQINFRSTYKNAEYAVVSTTGSGKQRWCIRSHTAAKKKKEETPPVD
jgi:hypothetical protein